MIKGYEIRGWKGLRRLYDAPNGNYHLVDKCGRAYLCGCMSPNIRGVQLYRSRPFKGSLKKYRSKYNIRTYWND